jgi:hypothetical protein
MMAAALVAASAVAPGITLAQAPGINRTDLQRQAGEAGLRSVLTPLLPPLLFSRWRKTRIHPAMGARL